MKKERKKERKERKKERKKEYRMKERKKKRKKEKERQKGRKKKKILTGFRADDVHLKVPAGFSAPLYAPHPAFRADHLTGVALWQEVSEWVDSRPAVRHAGVVSSLDAALASQGLGTRGFVQFLLTVKVIFFIN